MKDVVFTEFIDLVEESPGLASSRFEAPALSGRVLLASDDVECQRLLSLFLRRAGLEADLVDNGRTAVEAALAKDYDLVLMDVQSPEMDGVAAIALLRAAGCFTPVVALAADVTVPEVQRCLGLGCMDVLAKPARPQRFYAVVVRHLRKPRAARSPDDEMMLELQLLCAEFRRGLPKRMAEIDAALQRGELESMARLVHTLKGSAGSYGHPEITHLCAGIEAALHAGKRADVQRDCATLRAAVEKALRTHA